ncbi:MAG: hypothetical protein Q4C49_00625 [Bacillota bacterium]|nr:hypothetical protein [Bacillota bacterium]
MNSASELNELDLANIDEDTKLSFLKNLKIGDIIVYNGQEYNFRSLSSNFVSVYSKRDKSGNSISAINISDIDSIKVQSIASIDEQFAFLTSQKSIMISKSEFEKDGLYLSDLLDGYYILNENPGENGDKELEIIPTYDVPVGKTIIKFPKLNFVDANRVGVVKSIYELSVGDYILGFNTSQNTTRVWKILTIDGENITGIASDFNLGSDGQIVPTGEFSITTTSIQNLKKAHGILYKPNNIGAVKESTISAPDATVSLSAKGKKLLDTLASKFGTTIRFISESTSNDFARVVNGEV